MTGQLVWAHVRDDADDSHTPATSGRGPARSLRPNELAHAAVMGALCAAIAVIALTFLVRLRQLLFHTITATVDGVATAMSRVPPLEASAQGMKQFTADALHYWQWLIVGYAVVAIMGASLVGWWALSRVLVRL